jgi:hypothetical protein
MAISLINIMRKEKEGRMNRKNCQGRRCEEKGNEEELAS